MSNGIVILDKKQAKLDDCQSIDSFQKEMQSNIAFSSQVSSLIFSSIRREYMENSNSLKVGKVVSNGINSNPIVWIKITEIGLSEKNQAFDIHTVMEQLLQSLHLPNHYRILFEVSSNAKCVEVKLGVQSVTASKIYDNVSTPDPYIEVFAKKVGDFAKINFPGLKYEIVLGNNSNENAMIQSLKNEENASIRCITGLPSFRDKNQQTEFASIDRLANALQEYKWSYIVIAEPIVNQVVDQILNTSLDLAGKIESMKSFQIGKSLSESNSETGGTSEYGVPLSGVVREFLSLVSDKFITAQKGKNIIEEIRKATLGKSQNSSFSITNGTTMNQNIINKYAEHTSKLIDAQVDRLQLTEALGAWDVGCYFVAENDHVADTGAAIIKSLSSGDVSWYEPLRTHNLCTPLWQLAVIKKTQDNPFDILQKYENPNVVAFDKESQNSIIHPFDTANIHLFSYYRTLLNSRELSRLINFPTQSMPGVIAHRVLSDTGLSVQSPEGKINFGKQVYRGSIMEKFPYYINPDSFSKHSLVCGISRSGKTNTIIGVLNEMQKKQIPFMVIEPAKQEYVEWAIQQNKMLEKELGSVEKAQSDPRWINIYIPGRESFRGTDLEKLYLNPFDFVWLNDEEEPKTAEHIDRLKTVINAALPMYEILPVLMEELIYSAYSVKHARLSENDKYPSWLPNTSQERYPYFDEKIHIPSFQELRMLIPKIFEKRAYAQDVSRNLRAALETRIDSFKRGWRKELLNRDNPRKTRADWEKLFARPTVVNLTSLTSDEDKAFFMSVLLLFIYEFNQEKYELNQLPGNGKLNHLLIIEEAHRVLEKCEGAGTSSAAPKQKVSEMFSNMISEVGAYGQGIMIADQVPSRLNNDAIKNTNLKIVHKLVSADDRNAMATALNLQDDQERIIGELSVGEVLLRTDMDKDVYMVKVNKNK